MFFPTPYTFVPSRQLHASTDHPSFQTIYYTSDVDSNNYLMNHQCLGATPEQIREEVELYRRDFNARLMDILIGTLHAVYYGCFLPMIFVQVCTFQTKISFLENSISLYVVTHKRHFTSV